jgi:hypothetical protein
VVPENRVGCQFLRKAKEEISARIARVPGQQPILACAGQVEPFKGAREKRCEQAIPFTADFETQVVVRQRAVRSDDAGHRLREPQQSRRLTIPTADRVNPYPRKDEDDFCDNSGYTKPARCVVLPHSR